MQTYVEKSIADVYRTNGEILNKIFEHALTTRKRVSLSYRPCTKWEHIDMQQNSGVDFADFYPEWKAGDCAYYFSCMDGMFERRMLINVRATGAAELFFNGEKIAPTTAPDGTLDYFVNYRAGKNTMLIKLTATEKGFAAYSAPLVPELRYGAGGDYAYCTWHYIEKAGFGLQAGFELSRLYKKGEKLPAPDISAVEWVYPEMPLQTNEKQFDFNVSLQNGDCAYAYTYVQGKITITHTSPIKILSHGEELYRAKCGKLEKTFDKPTELLIKCVKANDWGFTAVTDGTHSLPGVDGADVPDLQWLWVGPFGKEGNGLDYPYPPENDLSFEKPFPTICGGAVYWNFYRKNVCLKQYLHSAFFGQWFYAIMVGHYGMLQTATALGKTDFYDYFCASIKSLCTHREYGKLDNARAGYSTYMANGGRVLNRLDPIGTIGMNVALCYMMTNDPDALSLLRLLADSLKHNVPRFEDGTFYRIETMWTDDTYMCLPFMARLGVIENDEQWFDDILTQVRGFVKRLYMDDEQLFSHIFFVKENKPNRVPWGRGNGWVLLALSEVLSLLPKSYHGRDEILGIYKDFAAGVLKHRDREKGIWHQVINNPESYIEASGSAMFITALARGVKNGWLDKAYAADIEEAWNALLKACVDADGNLYGVCKGSGCNMEEKYYLTLDTMKNDDHGVGIVLCAGTEVMSLGKIEK